MQDPGSSSQSHTQKKQSSYIVLVTSFDAVVVTFIYFVDRGMWECTCKSDIMDTEVISQFLLCELKDWIRALINAPVPLLTTPSQWLLQVFRDMFFVNLLSIDLFLDKLQWPIRSYTSLLPPTPTHTHTGKFEQFSVLGHLCLRIKLFVVCISK